MPPLQTGEKAGQKTASSPAKLANRRTSQALQTPRVLGTHGGMSRAGCHSRDPGAVPTAARPELSDPTPRPGAFASGDLPTRSCRVPWHDASARQRELPAGPERGFSEKGLLGVYATGGHSARVPPQARGGAGLPRARCPSPGTRACDHARVRDAAGGGQVCAASLCTWPRPLPAPRCPSVRPASPAQMRATLAHVRGSTLGL